MCCEEGQEKLPVPLQPGGRGSVLMSRARQERGQALLSPGISVTDRTLVTVRQQAGTVPGGAGVSLTYTCVHEEPVCLGLAPPPQFLASVQTLAVLGLMRSAASRNSGDGGHACADSPVLSIT